MTTPGPRPAEHDSRGDAHLAAAAERLRAAEFATVDPLLVLAVSVGDSVAQIPMAALVAENLAGRLGAATEDPGTAHWQGGHRYDAHRRGGRTGRSEHPHRLATFHQAAQARVQALREQLTTAEGLAGQLTAHLNLHTGGEPSCPRPAAAREVTVTITVNVTITVTVNVTVTVTGQD